MARPRKTAPEYKYHISGQARVYIAGKYYYLGEYGTPESRAKYRRLVSEYIATGEAPDEEAHQGEEPIKVADLTAEAREWIRERFHRSQAERMRMLRLCDTLDDEYRRRPSREVLNAQAGGTTRSIHRLGQLPQIRQPADEQRDPNLPLRALA